MSEAGNALKRERVRHRWSQAYVAERIGVDVGTISRWERGERFPHPYAKGKLCDLYKKSAEELGLIDGETKNTNNAVRDDETSEGGTSPQPHRHFLRVQRWHKVGLLAFFCLVLLLGIGLYERITLIPYDSYVGYVKMDDSLHDNNQGYQWAVGQSSSHNGLCSFSMDGYVVQGKDQRPSSVNCFANAVIFKNFAYQIDMRILQGDCGGLVFRANGAKLYRFEVCQDGMYSLIVALTSNPAKEKEFLVRFVSSPAIIKGLNRTNIIAVVARDETIQLYVNSTLVNTLLDGTYSQGVVGVSSTNIHALSKVIYANAKIWTFV